MTNQVKSNVTIKSLLQKFADVTTSKKHSLYYFTIGYSVFKKGIDPNIQDWLPKARVSQNSTPKGSWKNVNTRNSTSSFKMFKTAQKMSLTQAIKKFTEILEEGVFDVYYKRERIIFLEETDIDGNNLQLSCCYDSSYKLYFYISKVDSEIQSIDYDCAWFKP